MENWIGGLTWHAGVWVFDFTWTGTALFFYLLFFYSICGIRFIAINVSVRFNRPPIPVLPFPLALHLLSLPSSPAAHHPTQDIPDNFSTLDFAHALLPPPSLLKSREPI